MIDEKPFFVGTAPRWRRSLYEDKAEFDTFKEAEDCYYETVKDDTLFVYLGELGEYKNDHGNSKVDYMTFLSNDLNWWKENYVDYNHPKINDRWFGVPYSNEGVYATKYISVFCEESS